MSSNSELTKKKASDFSEAFVPEAGIEPAQDYSYWFLRPARLPIPPSGQVEIVKVRQ
jgi:hypothetical protein